MDEFERKLWGKRRLLMNYVMKQIGHRDDAEDIVSHTVIRALANRTKFDGKNIEAWLLTIAKNLIRDRHNKGYRKQTGDGQPRMTFTDDPHYADHLIAPENPERAMILAEAWNELRGLPEAQREVVTLMGLGFDYNTLAKTFNVPIGTIKSRAARAHAALKATEALSG